MRRDSFWLNLLNSFKPSFYEEAAFKQVANSIKYVFLLVLITTIIISTYIVFNLRTKSLEFLNSNKEKLYEVIKKIVVPLKIKDGKVSADVKQPYKERLSELGPKGFTLVIDTTGSITSLEEGEDGILITEDTLIVQSETKGTTDIKRYSLSQIKDFSIKPSDKTDEYFIVSSGGHTYYVTFDLLKTWVNIIFKIGWPLLIVFSYIFTLFAKFIQVLIFSLFVVILNLSSVKRLKYSNIFNIGIYAITPPTSLALINTAGGINFKYFNIVYIAVYLIYLALGFAYAKEGALKEEIRNDVRY